MAELSLRAERAPDGRAKVEASLSDRVVARDLINLASADDRRRFADAISGAVPAVRPESIEAELLLIDPERLPDSVPGPSRIEPGTQVAAGDRDNVGKVVAGYGDRCLVRFVSPEGNVAHKALPKSDLRAMDGKPLSPGHGVKPEPFPVDLLPPAVADYITEGAAARCVDPSMVALPLLVTLAGCIGTRRRIAIKPDWIEPPTIWGAVVAPSGSVKSPGFDLATDLLQDSESSAYREHVEAQAEYRRAKLEYEREASRWKRSKKDDAELPEEPPYPAAKRLQVEDVTIESLHPILAENPRGLLVMVDELRGWFDGMGAYSAKGSGRDESRWLSLHHARPFSIDRKTNREYRRIELATASVIGTIQPSVLADTMHNGTGVASGMLARLLLVMPPQRPKRWTDDELSADTAKAMQIVANRLRDDLEHDSDGDRIKPIDLSITPEARRRAKAFVNSHGLETYSQTESLAAAWSKLEAYAFRFALLDHLIRWASGDDLSCDGPIGVESMQAGIELSRWFGAEAERAYAGMGFSEPSSTPEDAGERHVDRLAEWLESHGGSATEREIGRGPRRYRGHENEPNIAADCKALIDAGRARWDTSRKTRRIVLATPGDTGDGDTSTKNAWKNAQVSPNTAPSVATAPATLGKRNGDTSTENTGKNAQVSPSPPSPPSDPEKRVRVVL